MLERAKQNTSSINGQFAYEVVDVTNIPFDNNLFDAVIANHMLYHLADKADRARAFSGIRRVLKQGGRFYASTNGLSHMRQMVELVNEFDSSIPFVTHIARNFSLETGPKEVADWFGEVELRRYDNELVVTEVQPLIDFILSTSTTFALEDERKVALSEFVRTRFAERGGVITIKKDPGIICAKRL